MGRAFSSSSNTLNIFQRHCDPPHLRKIKPSNKNGIRQIQHGKSLIFPDAFNQVLLGYTLLVILLSVSMDGLINNDSDSGVLVDGDYNFEIKTAIERTKNHAAFMMGIVALTFAAVVFVTVDWALLKYKNLNKAVWEVHVY